MDCASSGRMMDACYNMPEDQKNSFGGAQRLFVLQSLPFLGDTCLRIAVTEQDSLLEFSRRHGVFWEYFRWCAGTFLYEEACHVPPSGLESKTSWIANVRVRLEI